MKERDYFEKAGLYLQTLCDVEPNRRTGSPGNREATDFFASVIREYGYEVDETEFKCFDYICREAKLEATGKEYEVFANPYSTACDLESEVVVVSTMEELEGSEFTGKILLMHGELCAEQLSPKNFVFYNPEHHQKIVALLEEKSPAAIITASDKKPLQACAVDPCPIIVDGDFDIPGVYCSVETGEKILANASGKFSLKIDSQRIESSGSNVVARLNEGKDKKIVLTAHIDVYEAHENTPGAIDNASGIVVLLLTAQMLADYNGEKTIEIAALNGEDHYSVAGQLDYLERYGDQMKDIELLINIDGVGWQNGSVAYSFYECPAELKEKATAAFSDSEYLVAGEPWYSGDHMIFVQKGIPALAFTEEKLVALMKNIAHSAADTPDRVDCRRLVEVAQKITDFINKM